MVWGTRIPKVKLGEEAAAQIAVVDWLLLKKIPVFAVVNQGKRSFVDGKILKRMGLRAGVSDLFIFRPVDKYHGCFIEMKSSKGKLTKEQQVFLDEATKEGYLAFAARDSLTAIEALKVIYKV